MSIESYLDLHIKETAVKIAILGAGALGCAIGAALTEGGNEVWLLNRSAAHVEAMRRDGLRVDDADGLRRLRVKATTRAAEGRKTSCDRNDSQEAAQSCATLKS